MASLAGVFTLMDAASQTDPDGKPAKIAEKLSQTNEVLMDALWMPSNLPTNHKTTQRTGLPTIYKRRLNEGTLPSKATTAQITDGMTLLEGRSHLDVKLADIASDPATIRFNEGVAFMEAMAQEAARQIFYGSVAVDDTEFNGLQPRMNDLDADNLDQIINAGGTGEGSVYTSVYLVGWGDMKCYGIYPKGTSAGLQHIDLGRDLVADSTGIAGAQLLAYRDQWNWDLGLCLQDDRYVVRICNIDISDMQALTGTQETTDSTFLLKLMMDALDRIPSLNACKPIFYCNRTVRSALRNMALQRGINMVGIDSAEGRPKTTVGGVPVHLCDQITNTEAEVTASTVSVGG